MDTPRLLVITAEPDGRRSTVTLGVAVEELARRGPVETWFLRGGPAEPWTGAQRTIDDLRTWPPARWLERIGGTTAAGRLRGQRLRRWARALAPTVVVLDDGLGDRLLSSLDGRPRLVERRNAVAPSGAVLEPAATAAVDLILTSDGAGAGGGTTPVLAMPELLDVGRIRAEAQARRSAHRAEIGVAPDVPLVVGWGSDGWVDGPDLFVRLLWHLQDRHGIAAHGLWRGVEEPEEAERLRAEAERCGVGDRFHLVADDDEAGRWCGEVAFLPYRDPADPRVLLAAAAAGQRVVTFDAVPAELPWLAHVLPLDLDAAAAAVAVGVVEGTDGWRGAFDDVHDVARWADRFVAAVDRA